MSRHLPPAVCVILLLLALTHMPYGYYVFLRLCICVWCISEVAKRPLIITRVLLIGTVLLYNPVIRIPLTRPIWSVLNIITIILIIGIAVIERKHTATK